MGVFCLSVHSLVCLDIHLSIHMSMCLFLCSYVSSSPYVCQYICASVIKLIPISRLLIALFHARLLQYSLIQGIFGLHGYVALLADRTRDFSYLPNATLVETSHSPNPLRVYCLFPLLDIYIYVTGGCTGTLDGLVGSHTRLAIYPTLAICYQRVVICASLNTRFKRMQIVTYLANVKQLKSH